MYMCIHDDGYICSCGAFGWTPHSPPYRVAHLSRAECSVVCPNGRLSVLSCGRNGLIRYRSGAENYCVCVCYVL